MALGQSNLKSGVSTFMILIGRVLVRIEVELEPGKGGKPKAIQKGKLSKPPVIDMSKVLSKQDLQTVDL